MLTTSEIRFESIQTFLKITHLASMKCYMIIIIPNSYEQLTKNIRYMEIS